MPRHWPATGARPLLVVAGGLGGAAVALWNLLAPLTGVTGTPGALLVVATSLLVAGAGLVIGLMRPGGWRGALRILTALGILGTAAAAWFLHEWWLIAAMGVALLGLIVDLVAPRTVSEMSA